MKKRLCALLLCLLLSAALPLTAFAEEPPAPSVPPELTVSYERSGAALTVTVGIDHNPGIAGYDLALHFNSAVLTPSAEPTAPTGVWDYTETNYAQGFSGDTLKVISVNQENVKGDCTLFTAEFTVISDSSDAFVLRVGGTMCTLDAKGAEQLLALPDAYTDAFALQSVSRTANGVTAEIGSFGSCYHGAAKAIVSRYQGGKFVGCRLQSIQIGENTVTELNITGTVGNQETVRLMLTDENYAPLCAAVDVPLS